MIQTIAGKGRKGKTKHLFDKANAAIKESKGSIVYLGRSSKHTYELNNKIQLIGVQGYNLTGSSGFLGSICGTIPQDHDLETMFLDNFSELAYLEERGISDTIARLKSVDEIYHVAFILSVPMDADEFLENAKRDVVISL